MYLLRILALLNRPLVFETSAILFCTVLVKDSGLSGFFDHLVFSKVILYVFMNWKFAYARVLKK
jgi:hypothetical protein